MKKLVIVLFVTVLVAQSSETQLSPVVTYWKTLSIDEKETFLFSYLTQVYETHTELKKSEGYGGITEWYYNNRAELVYGIFDKLDEIKIHDLAKWVEYFEEDEIELTISRMGRIINLICPHTNRNYYQVYKLNKVEIPSKVQKGIFRKWCGHKLVN